MSAVFEFGEFRLDSHARVLARGGAALDIPAKSFEIVLQLAHARGAVVSKERLVECVWNGAAIGDGNISQHLLIARRALGDHCKPHRIIETVHGAGYRLVPDVRISARSPWQRAREAFRRETAMQYVRAARHFARMGTSTSIESSSELCRFALAQAPRCGDALAQLAHNELLRAACGYCSPAHALAAAQNHALQALAIDPRALAARLVSAFARLFSTGTAGALPDAGGAEASVLRMLDALSGENAAAALEIAERALRAYSSSVLARTYAAFVFYHCANVPRAVLELESVLNAAPAAAFARVLLGRALLAEHEDARARVHFETILFPRATFAARFEKFRGDAIAGLAYAAAREGDRHGAAALRNDLERYHAANAYAIALAASALGDAAARNDALERGRLQHDPRTHFARLDPLFRGRLSTLEQACCRGPGV
jgi:DNA-binding winged helix-turn-helix (wHTH) protein